jgi:hypothetical protein
MLQMIQNERSLQGLMMHAYHTCTIVDAVMACVLS